jgi:hypothetical protein
MNKWLSVYAWGIASVASITVAQNLWDFSKQDWAAWAQAVGTVGAVCVAIWVSTQQDRRLKEDRKINAQVVAAHLEPRIGAAIDAADLMIARIVFGRPELSNDEVYGRCANAASELSWSIPAEELAALIPISGSTSVRLARAIAILNMVANDIKRSAMAFSKNADHDYQDNLFKRWTQQLSDVRPLLWQSLDECHKAAAYLFIIKYVEDDYAEPGYFDS